ncbi:hypothetical protein GPJ56_008642 [Histomonas meleagridis]|uniref:uncharacterized protein n=1 Tax=Histomonas meleagridis TaxID=135588 RepID=UPI00355A3244|nr:hypothetical protein GPJ56_008642 [Histomonas meleagridis]KAH0805782.1 hypothetical protein GO595_001421 [Histomonas meleagridis]
MELKPLRMTALRITDFYDLINDLMREALSATGTWSLASIQKLKTKIFAFSMRESEIFIEEILKTLTDANTSPNSQFKIAQLLTTVHSMRINTVELAFQTHRERIEAIFPDIDSKQPFGRLTVSLLKSIYQGFQQMPRAESRTPTPQIHREQPIDRHTVSKYSKTPDQTFFKKDSDI